MARLCVALDLDWEKAFRIVRDLYDFFETYPLILKIGHRIYLERGGDAVRELKESFPYEVFLDLKLHDIPSVVAKAVEKIEELGADYTTLHLLGGREMVKEALKVRKNLKLLGVTILTSHDEEYLSYIKSSLETLRELVLHLASEGLKLGLDGFVSSAAEAKFLKERLGEDFLAVVPGIRIRKEKSADQKRVYSPAEAVKMGADIIVIGREITESTNPVYVVERALKLMGEI